MPSELVAHEPSRSPAQPQVPNLTSGPEPGSKAAVRRSYSGSSCERSPKRKVLLVPSVISARRTRLDRKNTPSSEGAEKRVKRKRAAVAAVMGGGVKPIRPGQIGPVLGDVGPIDRIFEPRVRRTEQDLNHVSGGSVPPAAEVVAVIAVIPGPLQVVLLEVGEKFHPESCPAGETAASSSGRE